MTRFDPTDEPLEEQLRRLPPAELPPDLLTRVERSWTTCDPLAGRSSTGSLLARTDGAQARVRDHGWAFGPGLRWAAGLAAAAVLVALAWPWRVPHNAPPRPLRPTTAAPSTLPTAAIPAEGRAHLQGLQPAAFVQEILQARDDGIVGTVHSVPLRRLRYEFLDTLRWENARGGASLEIRVPREEIWLVPVSTY